MAKRVSDCGTPKSCGKALTNGSCDGVMSKMRDGCQDGLRARLSQNVLDRFSAPAVQCVVQCKYSLTCFVRNRGSSAGPHLEILLNHAKFNGKS